MSSALDVIFLDMDGVCCDFVGAACALFNKSPRPWSHRELWVHGHIGITYAALWEQINSRGPTFWIHLEAYEFFDDLYRTARRCAQEVIFLTDPSGEPACAAGKIQWLRNNAGPDAKFIITKEKHLLAAPGRLLIDDGDANVARFEAAGGRAILWPQPWNARARMWERVATEDKGLRDLHDDTMSEINRLAFPADVQRERSASWSR